MTQKMTQLEVILAARKVKAYCKGRVSKYGEDACEKCMLSEEGLGCCRLDVWPEKWRISDSDFGGRVARIFATER